MDTEAVLKRAPQACEKGEKQARKKRQDSPQSIKTAKFFPPEAKRSTRTAVRLVFRVTESFLFFFLPFVFFFEPSSVVAACIREEVKEALVFGLLFSVQP